MVAKKTAKQSGTKKSSTKVISAKKVLAAKPTTSKSTDKKVTKRPGMDFIGFFPVRKKSSDKKIEAKKQGTGPVFSPGEYKGLYRESALGKVFMNEAEIAYLLRHNADKISWSRTSAVIDEECEILLDSSLPPSSEAQKWPTFYDVYAKLISNELDFAVLNMREIPLQLPEGISLAGSMHREDPRDAMVTRRTFGAIQELPYRAKVGTSSRARMMQAGSLRPDLEFVPLKGSIDTRLAALETNHLDAVLVAWASLRRLNISPRFYVSLQPEHLTPYACQGISGIVCRTIDTELVAKIHHVEDSEASWAARCERAFLSKLGSNYNLSAGVFAHRKGTQDPWILDSVIGDSETGEILRHREIGTSRCKPESLADKAYAGIISKGARKFLPLK